jgi:hypothetical protein
VLKGLQTPLPCLSFEYCVPEMTDKALECIDRLNQLNPGYLFNYSIGESMNFALEQWRNMGSFKELLLQKEFTGTLFGDIYCKLP